MWSGLSPGAGAVFTEIPYNPRMQQMAAPVFRAALNSFMLLGIPGCDGVFHHCPQTGCSTAADESVGGLISMHIPVCGRTQKNEPHDTLRYAVMVIFREAGLGDVLMEPAGMTVQGQYRPGDVVGTKGDAIVLVDVRTAHLGSDSNLTMAHKGYGVLCEHWEKSKLEDLARRKGALSSDSMVFHPFVVDSFGCMGPRAHALLTELAQWAVAHGQIRVGDISGQDPVSLLRARWRAYISCAVLGGYASRVRLYASVARAPVSLVPD